MRISSMAILASSLAFTTACSRQPDDAQIVRSVRTQIQKDPAVTGDVKVESANGFVTLSGGVASLVERSHAAEDARGVTGVRGVFNHLNIEEPAPESARQERRPNPVRRQNPTEYKGCVIRNREIFPGLNDGSVRVP